jgi:hypothetical protein
MVFSLRDSYGDRRKKKACPVFDHIGFGGQFSFGALSQSQKNLAVSKRSKDFLNVFPAWPERKKTDNFSPVELVHLIVVSERRKATSGCGKNALNKIPVSPGMADEEAFGLGQGRKKANRPEGFRGIGRKINVHEIYPPGVFLAQTMRLYPL